MTNGYGAVYAKDLGFEGDGPFVADDKLAYPFDTTVEVGECTTGWITYFAKDMKDPSQLNTVGYQNSVGDHTFWRF